MDFHAFVREVLRELHQEQDFCACNTREDGPCGWCWELMVAFDRLETALRIHTP